MGRRKAKQSQLFDDPSLFATAEAAGSFERIVLNRDRLMAALGQAFAEEDVVDLRKVVSVIRSSLEHEGPGLSGLLSSDGDWEDSVTVAKDVFAAELSQILEARTVERARYYLKRLARGFEGTKNGKINEINLL